MKKFLSLFIALAMVLSLFAGVGAKTAKAAVGVVSSTVVADSTTYVAGTSPVKITATTVYGDMSSFAASNIDGLVTLSKAFSTNVSITAYYGAGNWTTPVGTYVLPAGSTTFWLSNFAGDYTHSSTHQASLNTGATDVFNFSFTAPTDSGSVTITAKTVIAPTVYGGIGFEVEALRTVLSTATCTITISPNTLTVAKVVDPTLLYAGVPSYAYVYVTDVAGSPVTTLGAGAFTWGTGSITGLTMTKELGYGFYQLSGTPAGAGTANLIVTSGTATGTLSFNVAIKGDVWNPTLQIAKLAGGGFVIGGTVDTTETAFFYPGWNVGSGYALHDSDMTVTGPKVSSNVIWTGGQFVVTLDANIWKASATALTAAPIYGQQVFKISPSVTGDVVTIDPTTVNVGDTKDVTVTVLQASGIERNNGKVVLTGAKGMFTVPAVAAFTLDTTTSLTNDFVTYDAITANKNIVGGRYVFAGLTFNHAGTVDVRTYSGVPTGTPVLTSIGKITVGKRLHTLTGSVTKFVAGVPYPFIDVTGGITGLTFTGAYDDATPITVGVTVNADNSYRLNIPPVEDMSSITFTGLSGAYPDDAWVLTVPIVQPTIAITSVHADGLITDSLAETVTFTLTDPVTGSPLSFTAPKLAVQFTVWDVTGNDNLAVSSLKSGTPAVFGVADVSTLPSATASTGNPNLDATVDKPYLSIKATVNGVVITYADALLVSPAVITVTPKDLVLFYNQSNMFSVNALDAHKAPIEGANVWGKNDYLQTVPTTLFGGVTGADGTVGFQYVPNYIGEIEIVTDLGVAPYVVQIVPAPADTTAPVIKVAEGLDGSTVTTDVLKLTGTVSEKVAALYVGFNKVDVLPDGSFMTTVKLAAGANTIDMTAYDLAGNKGTLSVKVTYTAPKTGTVIVLTVGTDVVTVDGKATSIDAAPEIINSRTFVPIRFIAETFGADVEYLAETQGITITLGDSTIGLQIGNATAVIDGNIVSLPAAPYIKNGRTMVPLRVISDAFGGDVVWDAALRTITITYVQ